MDELGFEHEAFGRGAGEEAVDFERGFGAKYIDGTKTLSIQVVGTIRRATSR